MGVEVGVVGNGAVVVAVAVQMWLEEEDQDGRWGCGDLL